MDSETMQRRAWHVAHAIQRAKERLGVSLTEGHLERLVVDVQNGGTLHIRQISKRVTERVGRIGQLYVRFRYNNRSKMVCTILPMNAECENAIKLDKGSRL